MQPVVVGRKSGREIRSILLRLAIEWVFGDEDNIGSVVRMNELRDIGVIFTVIEDKC